jgi:hypothetical protein
MSFAPLTSPELKAFTQAQLQHLERNVAPHVCCWHLADVDVDARNVR